MPPTRLAGSGAISTDDLQDEIRATWRWPPRSGRGRRGSPQGRSRAQKDFGNVALTTEAAAACGRPRGVEAVRVLRDVRSAFRDARQNPGFSLTVIAVVALGIGLNAAVFTLFKGLALSPLSGVEGSAGLAVVLQRDDRTQAHSRIPTTSTSAITTARSPGSRLAHSTIQHGSRHRGERVMGELVSGNYFQLLGVRAQIGRTFLPSDDIAPGQHPVAVLSDGLWRRTFGADPAIVGKTVHLNAQPLTVVGVADPSSTAPSSASTSRSSSR